ncbi:hypothetical protein A1O3_07742 [Capronia epimyces CBS 606.96]|uniref:Thymocyte nuclear protein 1 n=1 Tax=Capronia epimyces CBS 606.96 TaxID=1182542 RepID=W9XVT2_9EURO|nr:uncharacterized protein A1O3_07742 [Capronia epimyces CBS 606.96]EXJ81450.1 hypothetical protein A1O3_07742 [Capronia epimyces CBS 606.96]
MPPRKRKASSTAKAGAGSAKKVRIATVASDLPSTSPALSPSGRPKRTSVGEPKYDFTRRRGTGGKVGRPSRADIAAARAAQAQTQPPIPASHPKRVGRPKRSGTASPASHASTPKPVANQTPKKRGRPPKAKPDPNDVLANGSDSSTVNVTANARPKTVDLENVDPDIQYWLMKAEPESRFEKGHDVKFSIDDLMARTEPEPWDGVRNPVARNNMRAMRKGDLAFFYHSNCANPGIVGVMRIVAEHTVDESAFDPDHPYYDPKSDRSKPKWEVVHVEFVKKFDQIITLKRLKSFSLPSGRLENMQTLRQSRLSVSSVTPAEWEFILELAGEPLSLGHGAGKDGYESDVDGEGDETAADADVDVGADTDAVKEFSGKDDDDDVGVENGVEL